MIYQTLKGLFTFEGQAQLIFYLKLWMHGGIVFYQLDGFPLGQVTFQYVEPDVF